MAHKFQPADDKYWAEQKNKTRTSIIKIQNRNCS